MPHVLPWTKFTPIGRPLGHVLNSEQLRLLKAQSRMWWCSWVFLTKYSNTTQKTSLDARRESPNLPSNRSPCYLQWEGQKSAMNILSADHKPLCSEDAQARPRILSTRTQCLDSQPHSCCITLSPPLTYGELLTGVPKSMVT